MHQLRVSREGDRLFLSSHVDKLGENDCSVADAHQLFPAPDEGEQLVITAIIRLRLHPRAAGACFGSRLRGPA